MLGFDSFGRHRRLAYILEYTKMSKLPEKYKPTAPPVKTAKGPDLNEAPVDDAQFVASMRRKGAVTVSENYLHDLEKIGIAAKNAGTLKIGRGQALITQQKVEELTEMIIQAARLEMTRKVRGKLKMADAKRLCMFATAAAVLSKASTESQRLMLEIEEAKPGGATDDDIPAVKSFAPGAVVSPGNNNIVANQVHIHTTPQPEAEKKS